VIKKKMKKADLCTKYKDEGENIRVKGERFIADKHY